ncbi:MAG: hypothetical protein COA74_09065 [Gammaproteobacteria bacterium]|nr:MAG: hypothetical protein COA74_09065 [Gammaproteobacteria bacterium]
MIADEQSSTPADYHYQGELKVDPISGFIKASWQIDVLNLKISTVRFFLRNTLGHIEVSGSSILNKSISQFKGMENFWAIDITLEKNVGAQHISISYDGILIPEPMDNKINSIKADSIELNVDSLWYPIDATFSKTLTVDLDIEIGKDWVGVSSGEFSKIDKGLNLTNHHAALNIPFALSNSFMITKKYGFTVYDLRNTSKGLDELIATASFCKKYLDDLYGTKQKLPSARLLLTTRQSSGYARNNYIVFTDVSNTKPIPQTKFVCHEMAHFWSSAGKFDTVDNWLNEAFAEYVGIMAVRKRYGESDYNKLISGYRKQIKGKELSAIWIAGETERKSYLVQYRKGPVALFWLETTLGRELFGKFIKHYMVNSIATTPELISALEEIAGSSVTERFVSILGEYSSNGDKPRE